MAWVLEERGRRSVAFHVRTGGTEPSFDPSKTTCILDIYTNLTTSLGEHGLDVPGHPGNFSRWVHPEANECIAVTGLTSCGAVFVATEDFQWIAAGHMSGDVRFVGEWCDGLLEGGKHVPHYLLWATGTTGDGAERGKPLLEYMNRLKIPPARAPAVVGCGAVLFTRTPSGLAYATRDVEINFIRKGRGSKPKVDTSREALQRTQCLDLMDLDGLETKHAYMVLSTMGGQLAKSPNPFPFSSIDAAVQEQQIRADGRKVVGEYLATLPASLRPMVLGLKVFTTYPELTR